MVSFSLSIVLMVCENNFGSFRGRLWLTVVVVDAEHFIYFAAIHSLTMLAHSFGLDLHQHELKVED